MTYTTLSLSLPIYKYTLLLPPLFHHLKTYLSSRLSIIKAHLYVFFLDPSITIHIAFILFKNTSTSVQTDHRSSWWKCWQRKLVRLIVLVGAHGSCCVWHCYGQERAASWWWNCGLSPSSWRATLLLHQQSQDHKSITLSASSPSTRPPFSISKCTVHPPCASTFLA